MKRSLLWAVALLLLLLAVPAAAVAQATDRTLVLPSNQIWLIIIGSLVPLVTYVINHVGPWMTEPIKAAVLVVAAAIAGALDTAITTNSFGWNGTTAELIVTAIFAALTAHHLLWKPSGIAFKLGAGTNKVGGTPAP